MVDQVSLDQGLVSNNNMLAAPVNVTAPAANNQSLFQLPDPSVNNYANDFMMQNLDFNAMAAGIYPNGQIPQVPAQNQPQTQTIVPNQPAQQQAVPTFSGNDNVNTSELDNCLTQRDQNLVQTENGNTYRKKKKKKKTGAAVGLAAPVAVKGFELFKAGALKNIFKSKSLLVSCPLVAAAGLGIGWLLDGFINSKRAQKADAATQPQVQPQTQPQLQAKV